MADTPKKIYMWLEYCRACGRKHYYKMDTCVTCGVYDAPRPAHEGVEENCGQTYRCDGCEAYQEHLAV